MADDTGKRGQHASARADASVGIDGLKPRNTVGRIGLLQFLRLCHLVAFRGTYLSLHFLRYYAVSSMIVKMSQRNFRSAQQMSRKTRKDTLHLHFQKTQPGVGPPKCPEKSPWGTALSLESNRC
jgi:hypothetical protein